MEQGMDRLMRGARCGRLLVAIWAAAMLAPAGLAEESARPAGATCTPTKLVIVVTSLDTNAVVIVLAPVALRVHVVDDCGEVVIQGSVVAFLTRPLALSSLGLGDWGATIIPSQTGQLSVSIEAQDPSGLLKGTTTLPVTVNGVPPVHISVLRVHDPNAFAVPGGEPIAIDVSLTSDGVPVEFFVSKVMFNLNPGQYTVNPARATTPATVQILVSVPLSQDSRVLYQIYPTIS